MRVSYILLLISVGTTSALAGEFQFALHEIDQPGGRAYGQTSLLDVDGDGDLDFITGRRQGDVWWFEYRGPDEWVRHRIGDNAQTDVGGAAFDVDGDGWPDQVSGATLYLHPGKNAVRSQPFRRVDINTIYSHDNRLADIDGDGRLDLLAMHEKQGVWWYRVPADATQEWPGVRVGDARHSGIAAGDVDGDGDIDIVRADWWFENADGKGVQWVKHQNIRFPGKRYNEFGMATQSRLADLDDDGDLDLAMTDGETKNAMIAWIENADGRGRSWTIHTLETGLGALHSLIAADFDNDGDLDLFTCEMHIGGEARWFIWENTGRAQQRFVKHIILRGVEGHESVAGDVDGDSDLDICSKPWNSDRHVYLENLLIRKAAP